MSADRYTKDRKFDKKVCTNSTEKIQNNKKAENATEEVEEHFPGFMTITDCT